MDISIIIGLLVALVIICATTIINNVISSNYKVLKNKWTDRAEVITDTTICVGNISKLIDKISDKREFTDEEKWYISSISSNMNRLLDTIRNYERNNY